MPLHVKTAREAAGVDLLIIGVKYGALQEVLPLVEKIVDEHTIVMSPLNGIDSESIVGERIGMEHMVYSLMKIAAQRVENQITYDPDVTLGLFSVRKTEAEVSGYWRSRHCCLIQECTIISVTILNRIFGLNMR